LAGLVARQTRGCRRPWVIAAIARDREEREEIKRRERKLDQETGRVRARGREGKVWPARGGADRRHSVE